MNRPICCLPARTRRMQVLIKCLRTILVVCFLAITPHAQADSGQVPERPNQSGTATPAVEDKQSSRETQAASPDRVDGHELIKLEKLNPRNASPDTYEMLLRERRWCVSQLKFVNEKLASLAARSRQKPNPVPTISEADYNSKIFELDSRIKQVEKSQSDSSLEERQRVAAQLELVDLTRQRARLDLNLVASRAFRQMEADYIVSTGIEAEYNRRKQIVDVYLSAVDDTINGMLLSTENNNRFRLIIGGAFSALVGMVILGFFLIAWKDEGIKNSFLSNDRGLQFVALFSLIIAIILFGVMNILEGKELSALLGGLSGYILGRSSFGEIKKADEEQKDQQRDITITNPVK